MQDLAVRPGLGDADLETAGHQIESRNFVYTVTPTVCSVDDDKDGLGDHEEPAVTFCPESAATGGDDRNPDDYRRVTVQIGWSLQGGDAESLTQRGLVTNPVGGLGPSVTSLTGPELVVTDATENPTYDIVTSPVADTVSWSVDGARNSAEGADTSWGFTWALGPVNSPAVLDCTYVLQAEAFDEKGRAGTPNALTVTINRRQPFAPSGFAGGRNLSGDGSTVAYVDLQWNSSPECDVKEYRVYRGPSGGSVTTLVCTRTNSQPKRCVDETAPAGQDLVYEVVAVDTPANGRDEEGDPATLEVESEQGLTKPAFPTEASLSLCTGDGISATCPDIDGNPAPDDTAVLSWPEATDADGILFYRVYRTNGPADAEDEPSYADRFDVLYKVPDKPLVFVDATNTTTHSYWVTAVDQLFGESAPVGPVTWQP